MPSQQTKFSGEDLKITENWNFNYPVFTPVAHKNNRAIILLHGLNERDWTKYLTWAKYLAEQTRRTVILFPIAFHMNRGKKEWSDPRAMNHWVSSRKSTHQNIIQLSFANVALSNRLSEDPLRFYRAGLQSSHDLIQLLREIKKGEHPLLEKDTQINFFGYSIGAFLTQIMFMANPDKLLGNSKALLFCGGTTFNNMSGTSRLIMDNLAYKNLNEFYMYQFEQNPISKTMNHLSSQLNAIVKSFKAMIPIPSFSKLKEKAFLQVSKKITAIGLLKDEVIPAKNIMETLNSKKINFQFHMLDFPYKYSHENPFPVFNHEQSKLVDKSFEMIFSNVAHILK
jgi:pimeloyl-ACP methyl ester carboxylesterase